MEEHTAVVAEYNEIKENENLIQYRANIHSSIPFDMPYTSDGIFIAEFQIENKGNIEIMPSKESKIFSGHKIFSSLYIHFLDSQGKDI